MISCHWGYDNDFIARSYFGGILMKVGGSIEIAKYLLLTYISTSLSTLFLIEQQAAKIQVIQQLNFLPQIPSLGFLIADDQVIKFNQTSLVWIFGGSHVQIDFKSADWDWVKQCRRLAT